MININDLTLGQIKELSGVLGINAQANNASQLKGLNCMIGKKVIIRTYSAGVWFGELEQKSGNEVILKNARRMWRWWAKESISLSAVAIHGVKEDKSRVAEAVSQQWLEAIEITPCEQAAIDSIEGCKNAKAE